MRLNGGQFVLLIDILSLIAACFVLSVNDISHNLKLFSHTSVLLLQKKL